MMPRNKQKKRFALVSVSDKSDLEVLVRGLVRNNFSIISTGGTYDAIEQIAKNENLDIDLFAVQEITHFPECLDGRVKTFHPVIEGGILYDRNNVDHCRQAKEFGFPNIELLVCNLYPFEAAVEAESDLDELIENLDVGGPTMIMSALKNYKSVGVIIDPDDYFEIMKELNCGALSRTTKRELATKAINFIAEYRGTNAVELSSQFSGQDTIRLSGTKGKELRYGENPHQSATFYPSELFEELRCVKEMSYNNFLDANFAYRVISELNSVFDGACAVVIKHQVPCGIATAKTLKDALEYAIDGDPISAFGSVIALSSSADLDTLRLLCEKKNMQGKKGYFTEVILAPDFDKDALDFWKSKKSKRDVRLLRYDPNFVGFESGSDVKVLECGYLVQDRDDIIHDEFNIVTNRDIDLVSKELFEFASFAVKHARSNSIAIVREYRDGFYQLLGLGVGQPNRIDSAKLAINLARNNLRRESPKFVDDDLQTSQFANTHVNKSIGNCVCASEAFFPFRDTVDYLAHFGIRYIVQPGGSKRDDDVIAAADENDIAMVFTNTRHFLH